MLTEQQTNNVWERMVQAEVRAHYFADLAGSAVRQKQWISGLTLFLSSGAAATFVADYSLYGAAMSIAVALMNAYAIAAGLDRKASGLANLHGDWNALADSYRSIWHNWVTERAPADYADSVRTEQRLSRESTEAAYDERRIEKWANVVFSRYQQESAV